MQKQVEKAPPPNAPGDGRSFGTEIPADFRGSGTRRKLATPAPLAEPPRAIVVGETEWDRRGMEREKDK